MKKTIKNKQLGSSRKVEARTHKAPEVCILDPSKPGDEAVREQLACIEFDITKPKTKRGTETILTDMCDKIHRQRKKKRKKRTRRGTRILVARYI